MALPEGSSCTACGRTAAPGDVECRRCGTTLEAGWHRPPGLRLYAPSGPAVDATRYLCAGAYLDEEFAKRVVEELFGQRLRALAPSYGFDVRPVAVHCLAAHRSRRRRDVLVTILGLAMLVFGSLTAVLVGVAWAAFGWLLGRVGDWRGRVGLPDTRVTARYVAALLGIAIVWAAIAAFVGGLRNVPAVPTGVGVLLLVGLAFGQVLAILGWLVLYSIVLVDRIARLHTVLRRLNREVFPGRPERSVLLLGRTRARLDEISSGQHGNVAVYSKYDPFLGAGHKAPGWSFAVPLVAAPGHEGAAELFSVAELVTHVRRRIAAIAALDGVRVQGGGDDSLRGLVVDDRIFVHGIAVEGDERFVPRRGITPRLRLDDEELERIARDPHGAVRHYCAVRVVSWRGEIVTSVFFHLSTDGEKLYCQWVPRVLGPIRQDFRVGDFLSPALTPAMLVQQALTAAALTVPLVLTAPMRIVSDLRGGVRASRDTIIDYGARFSVREHGAEASKEYGRFGCHNYFQELDIDKHHKIVERQALAAIVQFLEEHGIDAAELKSRQDTILNDHSINIFGDRNVVKDVVTGPGARVERGEEG